MLFIRKLHKWLGLIVGLQVVLWAISGLVFAWLDHHEVSAEHSVRTPEPITLAPSAMFAEPSLPAGEIYDVRLVSLLDRWVWRIESAGGIELRSTENGDRVTIDQSVVQRLAESRYVGNGRLQSVSLQVEPSPEARDAGPAWSVRFDDANQTALYFSAADGHFVAARNDSWRLFDVFWMLHTMDYRGRDNFNNPLVITFGTAALWLSLSGFILLFRSFRREDFGLLGRQ